MSAADLAPGPAGRPVLPAAPAFRQFPVAWRFALRNQSRNRLAWLLLVAFVPAWYLLMLAITGHTKLIFRLFATGRVLAVDGGHLTLISAGLNSVTIIVGFAVFAAIRRTLAFDQRLIFAGYRQATLIAAKASAIAVVAAAVAVFTALVLLAFWRPGLSGWLAIGAAFTVIALSYGAFGLFLGVLVRNDLEGFFLIIMGGLMDTFLQNPLGNPLANKPVLEWFPSFGPTQFAVGGAFGHTALWGHLALGLAWPAAFAAAGLIIFWIRTRTRAHAAETLPGAGRGEPTSLTVLWTTIATSKIRADWSWPMPDKRSPEARYPPGQAVADELVDTVLAASRALVAVAARSLAAAGDEVTLPQYRALVVLAARGPRGTAALAAALAVNPSTATRMCDRLVRKGLVRRHRQAGDRRAVRIALTATGRDLVAGVTRRRRAELARLLGALPPEEHEPVIAAFRAFAAAAGELPPPGAALGWAGP